jgi:hypothetical protein
MSRRVAAASAAVTMTDYRQVVVAPVSGRGRAGCSAFSTPARHIFRKFTRQPWMAVVVFPVMSGSVSIRVEQPSTATPASVYDILMDLDRWPDFTPGVSAASWEVRGAPDTGVGGIRKMRLALGVTRDRIVDGARPHHHAYAAAFRWYVPLKDYRGDIRIKTDRTGLSSCGPCHVRLDCRA